ASYLALWSLYRFGVHRAVLYEPTLKALQPFLLATLVAYCVGMLTLSLWVVTPTYIVLGLAAAYGRMNPCLPAPPPLRFNASVMGRFAVAGFAFLVGIYVFVRLFINWA